MGLLWDYAKVGWSFAVTHFLEYKRVGGCVHLCCFQGLRAQVKLHIVTLLAPCHGEGRPIPSSSQKERTKNSAEEKHQQLQEKPVLFQTQLGGGGGGGGGGGWTEFSNSLQFEKLLSTSQLMADNA